MWAFLGSKLAGASLKLLPWLMLGAAVWLTIQAVERALDEWAAVHAELAEVRGHNTLLAERLAFQAQQMSQQRERIAALDQAVQRAQEQRAAAVAVFNEHNFGELLQAKPGLIETRANRATRQLIRDAQELAKGAAP